MITIFWIGEKMIQMFWVAEGRRTMRTEFMYKKSELISTSSILPFKI